MKKVFNRILFTHVQQYVREVYAEQLHKAGFCSYKGEDVFWFRLVNHEVIHGIYFFTDRPEFPLLLEIGYGCHPSFIPPVFRRSPYIHPKPGDEQLYNIIPELVPGSMPRGVQRSFIHGLTNKIYREPDVLVHCPADDQTSQMILERILSVLEPIDTPAACYAIHKQWRASQIENDSWITMTPHFVDEVLYSCDTTLYPYCLRYIESKREWLESIKQAGMLSRKNDQEELAQLLVLQDVIRNERQEQYIKTLTEKARRNLVQLKKHTNI